MFRVPNCPLEEQLIRIINYLVSDVTIIKVSFQRGGTVDNILLSFEMRGMVE
jgi:hypothetical protein